MLEHPSFRPKVERLSISSPSRLTRTRFSTRALALLPAQRTNFLRLITTPRCGAALRMQRMSVCLYTWPPNYHVTMLMSAIQVSSLRVVVKIPATTSVVVVPSTTAELATRSLRKLMDLPIRASAEWRCCLGRRSFQDLSTCLAYRKSEPASISIQNTVAAGSMDRLPLDLSTKSGIADLGPEGTLHHGASRYDGLDRLSEPFFSMWFVGYQHVASIG